LSTALKIVIGAACAAGYGLAVVTRPQPWRREPAGGGFGLSSELPVGNSKQWDDAWLDNTQERLIFGVVNDPLCSSDASETLNLLKLFGTCYDRKAMGRRRLLHRSFGGILKPMILCGTLSVIQLGNDAASPQTSERPPFSLKVHVDLVILNVAVVDEKGANVTSLGKQDFVVYEDDVEQQVADFLPVEAPFHLVLALDTSISTRSSLTLIKKAASNFTDQLRLSDQIAISEINSSVREIQGFTSDRRRLKKAIDRIATASSGGSRIYDGVADATKKLQKSEGGRRAVIMLSDGMENSSRVKFEDLRRLLAQSDVVFYPVTILNTGSQKDMLEDFIKKADKKKPDLAPYVENAKVSLSVLEEVYQIQTERLRTLTDESGGKIFLVADLADLAQEYAKVAHELRNTFSLAYYSNNTDRDGTMRKIRVEVRDPRYRVHTRTGYFVPKD